MSKNKAMLDIVIIADTRLKGSEARSFHELLRSLASLEFDVGVLPVCGPLAETNSDRIPNLQPLIERHPRVSIVDPADPVRCQLLLGYHVACFLHPWNRSCQLNADAALVRIDQPLTTTDDRTLADIRTIIRLAEELAGGAVRLAPNDDMVRAALIDAGIDAGQSGRLTERNWPPMVAPRLIEARSDRPAPDRARKGRFRFGRHDADRPGCWPKAEDARAHMLASSDRWSLALSACGAFGGSAVASSDVTDDAHLDADDPLGFLSSLDAYVTAVSEGLHAYVDAALAEALTAGLPVVAEGPFERLLSDARLTVEDGDWQAAYSSLDTKALSSARKAASELGKRFSSDQLKTRLAEFEIEPATRRQKLTLKRESRSQAQVLFISPNGIGMGHLTRLLAVARRLEPWLQPVFLTMSQGAGVVDDFGFTVEYTPYFKSYDGDEEQWQRAFQARLEQVIAFYDPRVVVFDGNVPYRALTDVCKSCPERFFVWCRRGLWRRNVPAHIVERERSFDWVVEPRDHAEAYDRGPTVARRDRAIRISPITLLDPAEIEPRAKVRRELGLPMDVTAVLIMLGSGNNFAMSGVAETVLDLLQEHDDVVVRQAKWMISHQEPAEERSIDIEGYPFARHFDAFDLAISAAGYNSFHEIMTSRLPTIFVPNDNPSMDDQAARALWAERSGLAYAVHAWDRFRLGWALDRLLDETMRQDMRRRMDKLSSANGAADFADLIRDLALCRKADQPGLDRVITLPR